MEYKKAEGGVCAAKGFKASGIHCGIRKSRAKKDIALIMSECEGNAAAIYTQNLVKGAPIAVTRSNIADGHARCFLCNSGNANTCNADGEYVAKEMCRAASEALDIAPEDVIIASTGVIGQPLPLEPIKSSMKQLAEALKSDGSGDAAEAIMTTDTQKKEIAFEFACGGKTCTIGGIAKGSGMIHPNMATMLVFVTTDAAISSEMLAKALYNDAQDSFNMISVDGDTSTNDMVSIIANGLAGNSKIVSAGADYDAFCGALSAVTMYLCRMIAKDGEGATKLLECHVAGAADIAAAKKAAKAVICSSLVKAAMFGSDANWGRVLCAVGYSGIPTDVTKIGVLFSSAAGSIEVCRGGAGVDFSEEKAKTILSQDEIIIEVTLGDGSAEATAFGCDLTYDYVRINGDYRT